MQIVWKLKQGFIRDIVDEFPEPKPHYNTVKKNFFDGSLPNMMAFFAKNEKLSEAEIEELVKLIKSKKA